MQQQEVKSTLCEPLSPAVAHKFHHTALLLE
jgi:hypothetical protein